MPRIKRQRLTLSMRSQMISTAPEMNSRARTIFRNMASSIRPKSRRPSHVPARRNGRPITNSLIVSGVTVPLAPSQSALIRKMQTATGWNIARCTSLGQPRRPDHIVTRMPARPVMPARTPFRNPTPASAAAPAPVTGFSAGRKTHTGCKEPEKFRRRRARCADRPMSAV